MGKRIVQQARGKGGPRYRAPSFRYAGEARHRTLAEGTTAAVIVDLIKCQGHHAPLARIKYADGTECLVQAADGIKVGDAVHHGPEADTKTPGNTLALNDIPDGTLIFNIESQPGDGGKFCRTSGAFARIVGRFGDRVTVQLPSKAQRAFDTNCRACIGTVAGSGRKEKPVLKAGKRHFAMKARNKLYPKTGAAAQNAVDHPYGNKRTSRKAKNKPVSKHMPPGRKAGTLWPKRSGKRK
jgi:large subunit ribosomal protein L2